MCRWAGMGGDTKIEASSQCSDPMAPVATVISRTGEPVGQDSCCPRGKGSPGRAGLAKGPVKTLPRHDTNETLKLGKRWVSFGKRPTLLAF